MNHRASVLHSHIRSPPHSASLSPYLPLRSLFAPRSIVIVGGKYVGDHTTNRSVGALALHNIVSHPKSFWGPVYVVSSQFKSDSTTLPGVQNTYPNVHSMVVPAPPELAFICVPPTGVCSTVLDLAKMGTKNFVIFSAGFKEEGGPEGVQREELLKRIIVEHGLHIIGPNCVGFMNSCCIATFVTYVPPWAPSCFTTHAVDIVSGSGAAMLYILEEAAHRGVPFSSLIGVGNSVQYGVEEIIAYWDASYVPGQSSTVKAFYIENLRDPVLLMRSALSLRQKGCTLVAIKAGSTDAGSRAAASHSGALSSDDTAVGALFDKCGIIRCRGREEFVDVLAVLCHPPLRCLDKRLGIVTVTGGLGVMATDAAVRDGFLIPRFPDSATSDLRRKLLFSASTVNPIDVLATGRPEHYDAAIQFCHSRPDIDGIIVIFGDAPAPVQDNFKMILSHHLRSRTPQPQETGKSVRSPVYFVMPSPMSTSKECQDYVQKGGIYFQGEVALVHALKKVMQMRERESFTGAIQLEQYAASVQRVSSSLPPPGPSSSSTALQRKFRLHFERRPGGHGGLWFPEECFIARKEDISQEVNALRRSDPSVHSSTTRFVVKVLGVLHKSDQRGVALNILPNAESVKAVWMDFEKNIPDMTGVHIQRQICNTLPIELYIGAVRRPGMGVVLTVGIGGIAVEVYRDVVNFLAPVTCEEVVQGLEKNLRGWKLLHGFRGHAQVAVREFGEVVRLFSEYVLSTPEVLEVDLNPILFEHNKFYAVDVRIVC